MPPDCTHPHSTVPFPLGTRYQADCARRRYNCFVSSRTILLDLLDNRESETPPPTTTRRPRPIPLLGAIDRAGLLHRRRAVTKRDGKVTRDGQDCQGCGSRCYVQYRTNKEGTRIMTWTLRAPGTVDNPGCVKVCQLTALRVTFPGCAMMVTERPA